MEGHKVVSKDDWVSARKQLLAKEKEFTRLRDQLSQQRRELPWERVDKQYIFEGPNGSKETLADLFAGRSQLVIYHFMFGPDWEQGCPSCSFWADNVNGVIIHLNHRDVSFAAISHAPIDKLAAFKKRMGWGFKWVSSLSNDFNYDLGVSFTPEQVAAKENRYNYATQSPYDTESPGISVFFKDANGDIFHTYSCYARGLDMLNVAYHYLDLVPKGRDESSLPRNMAWVRYHDKYED